MQHIPRHPTALAGTLGRKRVAGPWVRAIADASEFRYSCTLAVRPCFGINAYVWSAFGR